MEHTRMPSPFRVLEEMTVSRQAQAPGRGPHAWGEAGGQSHPRGL